jgi:hypothetical protein
MAATVATGTVIAVEATVAVLEAGTAGKAAVIRAGITAVETLVEAIAVGGMAAVAMVAGIVEVMADIAEAVLAGLALLIVAAWVPDLQWAAGQLLRR